MSRDLLETSNDIATAESLLSSLAGEFDNSLSRQGRLTAEIQSRLMRLRMVPLSTIASRLSRTVRVTSQATGKLVKLSMDGFGVELDKTVLEQLASPLEHLLRNAVDHGIETPNRRRECDKPEQGAVQVVAAYEGTHVVIRIADDGGGVNADKIRSAAIQRGFAEEDEVAALAETLIPPPLGEGDREAVEGALSRTGAAHQDPLSRLRRQLPQRGSNSAPAAAASRTHP